MNQKRSGSSQRHTFQEIPNPYVPGSPLSSGDPTFFGREDVFNFIRQNIPSLAQKATLVLVGERRTGKTSILRCLPARLENQRYIPIFIDGQALGIDPGMGSFFLSMAAYIADGLEEVGVFMPRPRLAQIGESPQHWFEGSFLPMIREQIGERILLLTIDEFEHLGHLVRRGDLPDTLFPYLRHLIQHEKQLAFIFAGTHKIEEMIGDYWSVLLNLAVYKRIGFLEPEETIRLIREPVRPYGMTYDDMAVDEILRLTACHPYFTQLLCGILVHQCNDEHRNYVTIQNVQNAVRDLMEAGSAHLAFLWQSSDREDKVVLTALAELKEQSKQSTAVAIAGYLSERQLHLDPELVVQATEQLIDRDLLRSIPGDPPTLDFTAQLYAHWLRRFKSFSVALKETIVEEEWQRTKRSIDDVLFTSGSVALEQLTSIADPDRQFAWSRYIDTCRSEFDLIEAPLIRFRNQEGLNSLNEAWHRMVTAVTTGEAVEDTFDQCVEEIIEQLRLVGIQQLASQPLPEHRRLLPYLLDTRLIFEDTNLPPSIPLVFTRQLTIEEGSIPEIRHLLHTQLNRNVALAVVSDHHIPRQRTEDLLRHRLVAPDACDVVLLGLGELQRIIVAQQPATVLRRLVLSKVNLTSISPYVTTGATSDNIFFGREPELREIYQHIATVSYAIIGGRRIGKSSLLIRLHRIRLPAAGFRTVYQDCSSTPTYEDFINARIVGWQPEPPSDAPVTFGDLLHSPLGDRHLVLLLDEADKLVPADRAHEWRLFSTLRGLANSGRVQVVLSGERTLRDALRDPTSPLFNSANEMLLGPLNFRAVEELVTRPMKQLEIELVDEGAIVQRIHDFTSGHPNVVQRLCHRLIGRLNEQGTRRIRLGDIDAIIKDPDFIREDFLETYFSRASTLEHLCALLMATDKNLRTLTSVHETLVSRGVVATLNQVDAALERLVDLRSILYRTPEGYDFSVPAFPLIVSKSMRVPDWIALRREVFVQAGDIAPEEAPPELQGRLW